ncbi:MAG: HPr family phosphocarrier protein [Pirellulales bacterium]
MLVIQHPASSILHPGMMSRLPITRVLVIRNEQGLHARPAEMFVRLAKQFQSRIELVREGRRVEARNIIDLLTLGAGPGTELVLEAEGDDAEQAVDALVRLVENGFAAEETNNE